MPYLLDGNNLIGRVRRTARPTEEDRQALVAELSDRLRASPAPGRCCSSTVRAPAAGLEPWAPLDPRRPERDQRRPEGGYEPIRFTPAGRVVVMGLVSSKRRELEREDDVLRRLRRPSRYLPLDQLALSTQCGFASVMEGNEIDGETQWRKLDSSRASPTAFGPADYGCASRTISPAAPVRTMLADGRRTWAHGDGEAVSAEPGGEAIGVTVEPQLCDLYGAGPMGCRGAAWKLGPVSPLDEERERGLGGGLLDAGQPPPHKLAAPTGP